MGMMKSFPNLLVVLYLLLPLVLAESVLPLNEDLNTSEDLVRNARQGTGYEYYSTSGATPSTAATPSHTSWYDPAGSTTTYYPSWYTGTTAVPVATTAAPGSWPTASTEAGTGIGGTGTGTATGGAGTGGTGTGGTGTGGTGTGGTGSGGTGTGGTGTGGTGTGGTGTGGTGTGGTGSGGTGTGGTGTGGTGTGGTGTGTGGTQPGSGNGFAQIPHIGNAGVQRTSIVIGNQHPSQRLPFRRPNHRWGQYHRRGAYRGWRPYRIRGPSCNRRPQGSEEQATGETATGTGE